METPIWDLAQVTVPEVREIHKTTRIMIGNPRGPSHPHMHRPVAEEILTMMSLLQLNLGWQRHTVLRRLSNGFLHFV